MAKQIVGRYQVTLKRMVWEQVIYDVYAGNRQEANAIARERLCNDDMPVWETPDRWQTDTPLETQCVFEYDDESGQS
jgi:hypothetical protein